jgi:hypothetical protein
VGGKICRVVYFDGAAGFASNDEVQFACATPGCRCPIVRDRGQQQRDGGRVLRPHPELWATAGTVRRRDVCSLLPNIGPIPPLR